MTIVDQWWTKIPELHSRPLAIAKMQEIRHLRRNFERICHALMGVSGRLAGHVAASEVLGLLWRHRIQEFTRCWYPKMDISTFGQIHGALRNIYLNARARATDKPQPFRSVDVERSR